MKRIFLIILLGLSIILGATGCEEDLEGARNNLQTLEEVIDNSPIAQE